MARDHLRHGARSVVAEYAFCFKKIENLGFVFGDLRAQTLGEHALGRVDAQTLARRYEPNIESIKMRDEVGDAYISISSRSVSSMMGAVVTACSRSSISFARAATVGASKSRRNSKLMLKVSRMRAAACAASKGMAANAEEIFVNADKISAKNLPKDLT